MSEARRIIERFGLKPHPEGGWYTETFRDTRTDASGRAASTAILYLLDVGETSEWHRVRDAVEVWHFHAGAPLMLTLSPNGHDAQSIRLGSDMMAGEAPQVIVPADCWQTATSLGAWSLVGCTVAPGFMFESFERAPEDWRPTPRAPSRS